MNRGKAPIIANTEVMPRAYLIWLESPQIASEAKPGQFVMVNCGKESVLPRPLSIYKTNEQGIELLYKLVGKGTRWLSRRQEGETVELFGPLGNSFTIHPPSKNLLLVAGGIGIAPLRFLADEAIKQGRNITLALGHTQGASLNLLLQQITEVKAEASKNKVAARIVPVSEDGTLGIKGLVTNTLENLCPDADQVFACGPLPMYQEMARLPELQNKSVQISLEVRMGCGRGVCYGCTVKTRNGPKQVCKDGPVFDLDNILWNELDYL